MNNQVVGSKLIGQTFEQAKYFSGRSEEVSQLSPVSAEQKQLVEKRTVAELEKSSREKVPNDLVTASASGVDPILVWQQLIFNLPEFLKNVACLNNQFVNSSINIAKRLVFRPILCQCFAVKPSIR